jgi:hypothetical protein
MWIEHVNFIDLVVEGIKAILVLALIVTLWRSGKRYPELAGGSWNLIILGFVCIETGMLLDWSDETIDYNAIGIDLIETVIEEGILTLGFILITIGFDKWFEFIGRFLGISRQD